MVGVTMEGATCEIVFTTTVLICKRKKKTFGRFECVIKSTIGGQSLNAL